MREYSFKRGFRASEERLVEEMRKSFDSFEKREDRYTGRIEDAEFELHLEEKKLTVSTSKPGKGSAEVLKRYNYFIESFTGYSAKERRKKMLKEMNNSPP
jgi:hypothetical protein